MARIFKWQLDVVQRQFIHVPGHTRLLSVGVQNGFPVVWGEVEDDTFSLEARIIRGVTTGEIYGDLDMTFLGTAYLNEWFVFHVFEQSEGADDERSPRFDEDYKQIREELK